MKFFLWACAATAALFVASFYMTIPAWLIFMPLLLWVIGSIIALLFAIVVMFIIMAAMSAGLVSKKDFR